MSLMSKSLNLGCGSTKITGAINVDMNPDVKPDVVHDIKKRLPFNDEEFDEIYFFHCLEHLEKSSHPFVLNEIRRVLNKDGVLWISYPEFGVILKNWLDGKDRDFYEKAIYGRQLYPGDYHYSGIHTPDLIELFTQIGLKVQVARQEPDQTFNTVLKVVRSKPQMSYEELLHKEIFA